MQIPNTLKQIYRFFQEAGSNLWNGKSISKDYGVLATSIAVIGTVAIGIFYYYRKKPTQTRNKSITTQPKTPGEGATNPDKPVKQANQKTIPTAETSGFPEITCNIKNPISKELGTQYKALLEKEGFKDTPFFELQNGKLAIYFSKPEAVDYFARKLSFYSIQPQKFTASYPPNVEGFKEHNLCLQIPPSKLVNFLAISFKGKDEALKASKALFEAKNISWEHCYLNETREILFKEADADFYFPYCQQLAAFSKSNHEPDRAFFSYTCEEKDANPQNYENYLTSLLEVQGLFLCSDLKEIEKLSPKYRQFLLSLNSVLMPQVQMDDSARISRRLSEQFFQLIPFSNGQAPFVEFTSEGCLFFFDSKEDCKTVSKQFELHELVPAKPFAELKSNPKISDTLKTKLLNANANECCVVVPPPSLEALLSLARFHPYNVRKSLQEVYSNKGLKYENVLLTYASEHPGEAKNFPKMTATCTHTQLANGEIIAQFKVTIDPMITNRAGKIIFMLDDSGSMRVLAGNKSRIQTATNFAVNLIKKIHATQPKTKITVFSYSNKTAIFHNATKKSLNNDWENEILNLKSRSGDQLPNIIEPVSNSVKPAGRQNMRQKDLKNCTFIHISDGGEGKTASQMIKQFEKCLGTKKYPYSGILPIIPLCIGNESLEDEKVIRGLGKFAGHFFARDDHLEADLNEMGQFAQNKFAPKIANLVIGMFQEDKLKNSKKLLFTEYIELVASGSSLCFYQRFPVFDPALKCVISADGQTSLTPLTIKAAEKNQSKEMIVHYYESEWNKVLTEIEEIIEKGVEKATEPTDPRLKYVTTRWIPSPEQLKEHNDKVDPKELQAYREAKERYDKGTLDIVDHVKKECLQHINKFCTDFSDYSTFLPKLTESMKTLRDKIDSISLEDKIDIRDARTRAAVGRR